MKNWKILHKTKNIKHLTEKEIIAILLKNREIVGGNAIEEFLNPRLENITLTYLRLDKKELKNAIDRIIYAIRYEESIVVYTDYDADGICSGAIIWETLHKLGAKVMPYVPHRLKEGYGLSKIGIDQVIKKFNPKLIITVDHGISANEHVDYINNEGIDIIILDHHVKPKKIPRAFALVHTTDLCASGISWIFSQKLSESFARSFPKKAKSDTNYLELAAIGTVADLVPLKRANRSLVKFGIEQLNKTGRVGLKALIKNSGLVKGEIGVYEIGHILAPRINALGRITHAIDALRLLCTNDENRALELARILTGVNQDRQTLTVESSIKAIELVKKQISQSKTQRPDKLLFIASENFHQGIIGLIAGKLVEEFYRPVVVVSIGKEYSKASARSINGFNIVENIRMASHLLTNVGGHPMAAGFTIETTKLTQLKQFLISSAEKALPGDILERELKVDMEMDISLVTTQLYQEISKLAPFGIGNPEPVLLSRNVEVLQANLVGKARNHLKLKIRGGDKTGHKIINCIGFKLGEIYQKLSADKPVDIVYSITEDRWNSNNSLQLKLKDVNLTRIR